MWTGNEAKTRYTIEHVALIGTRLWPEYEYGDEVKTRTRELGMRLELAHVARG